MALHGNKENVWWKLSLQPNSCFCQITVYKETIELPNGIIFFFQRLPLSFFMNCQWKLLLDVLQAKIAWGRWLIDRRLYYFVHFASSSQNDFQLQTKLIGEDVFLDCCLSREKLSILWIFQWLLREYKSTVEWGCSDWSFFLSCCATSYLLCFWSFFDWKKKWRLNMKIMKRKLIKVSQ